MPKRTIWTRIRYGVVPVEAMDDGQGDNAEGRILWFQDEVTAERVEIPMFVSDAENLAKMLTAKPSEIEIATEMPPVPPPGGAQKR